MFIAIIFIAIGVAMLLNTLGIISGGFWGFFWSILFIVVGIKMLGVKACPICGWRLWKNNTDNCRCGCECECDDEDECDCDCNCNTKEHQHNIEE